jgi:hypothetical protein
MTLDGGKLPMQMDRVDEILNSAEIGIYRIILRKGEHPLQRPVSTTIAPLILLIF